MQCTFPTVRWGDEQVSFSSDCPKQLEPYVVVFVWNPSGFVLANIRDRGWCTPSGRVEPGESHLEAALRETREETGVKLADAAQIGCFLFNGSDGEARSIPAYLGYALEVGVPTEEDSLGAAIVGIEKLPECYYKWDSLLISVFEYVQSIAEDKACSMDIDAATWFQAHKRRD